MKDKIIVSCDCGCGTALAFDYIDEQMFASLLTPYAQPRHGDVEGLILSESDRIELLDWLLSHSCADFDVDNNSHFEAEWFDDILELLVVSDVPWYSGKKYLAGEIDINCEIRSQLIKMIEGENASGTRQSN